MKRVSMVRISEILNRIKSSEVITALFLLAKNIFSFKKRTNRKEFYWSIVWIILFLVTAYNIVGILSTVLLVVITIMTASLFVRRINDTGFSWYISVLPFIFPIMSVIALIVMTAANLTTIGAALGTGDVRFVGNFIDETATDFIIATITSVMACLAFLIYIVTRKKDQLKSRKVVKIIYVILPLVACLLFTATFSVFFTNIAKPIEQGEYSNRTIEKTIVANGVFNGGIEGENPDAVISYYESNKSQFEENFKKFAVGENKIADDVYCLPILSQNVTDGSVYPLIEIGILNTSKEVKEITIEDCSVENNYTVLSARQKLDPGVNFIPIKLYSLDKLSGGETFGLVVNNTTLIYSNLTDIKRYN